MNCKEGNQQLIIKLIDLVGQFDEHLYGRPLEVLHGASIGQHVRHIIDFYQCLTKGVKNNLVDYAKRDRNTSIERNPGIAIDCLYLIGETLAGFENKLVYVLSDFSASEYGQRMTVDSTINRELMFVHDHAVHHLAIIKIGIKTNFQHISINEEIGVAPATLRYRAGSQGA